MGLIRFIVSKSKELDKKLKVAHEKITPEEYVKSLLINAFMYGMLLTFFVFLILAKQRFMDPILRISILSGCFFIFTIMFYFFLSLNLDAKITRIQRDIDKEVVYAARFLLIKLKSGTPLFNALIEGTKAHGVAGKYFKEIVEDINLGTPIEEALMNAMLLTPSKKFKKILFCVNNALRLGIDVSTSLESVIQDIVNEQMNEIKAYSKKLSSIAMFYLLIAVVVPSLGLTVISIVLSFLSLQLDLVSYFIMLFIIFFIQMIFLSLFKSIRPNVSF